MGAVCVTITSEQHQAVYPVHVRLPLSHTLHMFMCYIIYNSKTLTNNYTKLQCLDTLDCPMFYTYSVSQKKTVPTYFLFLLCQIWTDFNKNCKDCPGINA